MTGALEGRSALITGGSMGLGYAIAEAFIRAGARVMICGRADAALQDAAYKLGAHSWLADVSEPADCNQLVAATLRAFPDLSILVNNAGVYGPMGPLEDNDLGEWVEAIKVNLLGSVYMARALLPHFKKQGYGKIIQVSGGGATKPMPNFSAYSASKAAVVRFAETLAEEVRGTGIDVNSMAPGLLDTRLTKEAVAAGYDFPVPGPMTKAVELAVFLASAASDGITGKLISANHDLWRTQEFRWLAETERLFTLRRIE